VETLQSINLSAESQVLDVGCGDGYSTLKIAEALPGVSLLGIDYADNMIGTALGRLESQNDLADRVTFKVGDMMVLNQACGNSIYDAMISDRCLINLDSFASQSRAIGEIVRHTKSGGYDVAIENFMEGHDQMNRARHSFGLPEIAINWHNLYFKEPAFVQSARRFFENTVFKDFSSLYYFATRVIYSAIYQMQGEEPDYRHDIHKVAVRLPWMGQFSLIRMVVLRRGPEGAG
jgi:ubiquinone/menaquinone biosynthesis C-methylase UbiE